MCDAGMGLAFWTNWEVPFPQNSGFHEKSDGYRGALTSQINVELPTITIWLVRTTWFSIQM